MMRQDGAAGRHQDGSRARRLAMALLVIACHVGAVAQAPPPAREARPAASASKPAAAAVRTLDWEALIPPDWDPMQDLKGIDFDILSDADPRAIEALARLRKVWDEAPVNPGLAGQRVRLPGYVVPLEETREGALKEFLLVPYFGACIHSPPPPANQIVHVLVERPVKGVRSMDTVWVTGAMSVLRTDSYMGVSGYRIDAAQVAPYTPKPPR
ncbi:MAG: DUF3299 domain-containing protein [Rubrivivax sp.]